MTPNEQYIAKDIKLFLELNHVREDTPLTGKACAVLIEKYNLWLEKKLVPEMTDAEIVNKAMELCPAHRNIVDGRPIPAAITDSCFIQGAKFYRDRNK